MCGRGNNTRFKDKKGQDLDDGFNKWGGYMAAKRAKLLDQFHTDTVKKISDIFAGVRILVNGLTHPPAVELKNLMAAHGGEYHAYQVSSTTHIIASNLPNVKIKHLGAVPVVKPSWITESVSLNKLLDYKRYLLYTNQSSLQPALKFPVITKLTTSEFTDEVNDQHSTISEDITAIIEDSELIEKNLDVLDATKVNSNTHIQDFIITNDNESKNLPTCSSLNSNNTSTRVTKTASDPKFLEEFYNNSRLHLISTLGAEFKQLVGQLREKSDGTFSGRKRLIAKNGNPNAPTHKVPSSVVMHIDMDCFFVSVGLRSHPELRGQPVAITHAKSGVINSNDPSRQEARDKEFALYEERLPQGAASRVVDIKEKIDGLASMSEIASCSYEARKYGIKNGMFMGQAVKQCPGLKTLPYDFEGYKEVSNMLYNTVASYTLDIEAVSCDEMYVDIKQILIDTGLTVEEWATYIRNEIMTITGCPCSTGFGANRLQARLATRKAKPAGQYYLKPEEVEDYMAEIPLSDVPGVGRAILAKLQNLGCNTCGDLQNSSLKVLQSELGNKLGERIWEQVHGKDNKPLEFNHERKSVSAEINYGIRFKTKEECYNFLQSLANEVFNRLSDINMKARGLTLKLLVRAEGAPVETAKYLGHGVCDVINKSSTANVLFSNAEIIYKEARSIYDKLKVPFDELRGVGIQLGKLEKTAPINKALSNFLKQGAVKKSCNETKSVTDTNDIKKGHVLDNQAWDEKSNITSEINIKNANNNQNGVDKVKEQASTAKSVVKDVFPNTKSRGRGTRGKRGNKQTANRTMQTFLKQPKTDQVPTTVNPENEDQAALSRLRDQIDLDVLNALPEDIRKEIMKEYRFDIKKPQNVSTTQKPSSSTKLNCSTTVKNNVAASQNGAKMNSNTSPTPPVTYSPFADQTWEQVKQGIKIWIQSEGEPASVDIEMLADHLRQLAMDRRIEVLKCGFNFLHRTFTNLSCPWHQAYFSLVDAVQQGMVARYGKILHIRTDFFCCIH